MPFISNLYTNAKRNNVLSGIIISDIIGFICFAIYPLGLFYSGDIQMIIGSIIGTRFALKYRKSNNHLLKLGIFISLGGTLLTAISISSFAWIIALLQTSGGFSLFPSIFIPKSLVAIIVGLLIGVVIGFLYHLKNQKLLTKPLVNDEFYESLKEK
jgi:cation transporter-like permease